MKKEEIENPQAFPRPWSKIKQHPDAPEQFSVSQSGMTLRDYLAAKAMQAIVTSTMSPIGLQNGDPRSVAEFAGEIADAMLKERSKQS